MNYVYFKVYIEKRYKGFQPKADIFSFMYTCVSTCEFTNQQVKHKLNPQFYYMHPVSYVHSKLNSLYNKN